MEKENLFYMAHVHERPLKLTLFIVVGIMIAEIIGGILSDSLALLSDAGHMAIDALALSLSWSAIRIARRPATLGKTYGYHRAEILAALINGTMLIVLAIIIFYEAYQRFSQPPEVKAPLMLTVAVIGLIANIAGVVLLKDEHRKSINIKAAFWHVLGDAISSLGVIIAGIIILITGFYLADSIAAIITGGIMIWGAVQVVTEVVNVLLEGVPRNISAGDVIATIRSIPGVNDIHDIHIWAITSSINALSAHLLIDDQMVSRSADIVAAVKGELKKQYNINHTTLQLECVDCSTGMVCNLIEIETEEDHEHI